MSILGWAVTALIPGAGIAGAVATFGAKLVFGKIFGGLQSAAGFAAAHWRLVAAVSAIGAALIFGLIERGEARHWRKVDAGHVVDLKGERAAHAITLQSLAGARAQIDDNNRRIDADAAELARERQQWTAEKAQLDQRWRQTSATSAAIAAAARDPKHAPCTVGDQAKKALEGL